MVRGIGWLILALSITGAYWLNSERAKQASQQPPIVGERSSKGAPNAPPKLQPAPRVPPAASATPVPDRNEIRLPLKPVKKDPGPVQVEQKPMDPNSIDADGVTPFMRAAAKGDVEMLAKFHDEQGAEINQMDNRAHTALHYAITGKSARAVEWLIVHGAEVDFSCCDGVHSPLLHALDTGELSVIEPVLQARRPHQWCRLARETLFKAVQLRNKPFIRTLLVNHYEPPTLEDSRQPLLGYAIAWGDSELLELLLECGADPNTPLNSPVDQDFARLVIDRSVRGYLETEPGMTPLMLAAGMNRLNDAQTLLRYGAKRGATTKHYKMTAIDLAARRDAGPQMLQVLLGKSPRPEDQRMRINISISDQRAVLYKDGLVAMVAPVSTGRPGFATPTGQFVVTDKDRMHRSTLYPAYMPYFLRMSCRDFGMHAGELPGYPASHGCIRLPWDSAERFYRAVDIGTLVTISR